MTEAGVEVDVVELGVDVVEPELGVDVVEPELGVDVVAGVDVVELGVDVVELVELGVDAVELGVDVVEPALGVDVVELVELGVDVVELGVDGAVLYMTRTPTRLTGRLLLAVPENTTLACEELVVKGSGLSNLQSLYICGAFSSIPSKNMM